MKKNHNHKQILVCAGSGGVGKTTLAATLALRGALEGKKSIVLTIDPAKRLATALGLSSLTDEPATVAGIPGPGQMDAMMLDTKRTFDRLIEKYSPSTAVRERILNNRLYQHMSSMMAGSQEYMAMERLYEIDQQGDYDLIVLDTPPTRHALDFLEAPKKMMNITSHSLLQWFLKPGLFAGRVGIGFLRKGSEKILAIFDQLAGFAFLYELSEMLSLIESFLSGFHERAESVYHLLREKRVGFVLVTTPQEMAVQDALYFYRMIQEYDLHFVGFMVNRVHTEFLSEEGFRWPKISDTLSRKLEVNYHNYQKLAERDQSAINLLKKVSKKKPLWGIPLQLKDVHDLDSLTKIKQYL